MIRGFIITILALGVAGTAYWGYHEHRDKNTVLLSAENNYQRAFHELTYHIDLLHDKIGTTLAMNSRQSLSPGLAEVWRLSSEAHSDVGQLPLTLLPFHKTLDFLNQVGNFSYQTAIRDLDKTPLSAKEYDTLKALYQQSDNIQTELRNVQHTVLKNKLHWMDVETALASGKSNNDNAIIDGFKTVEQTASNYAETDMGPTNTNMLEKDKILNHLHGKVLSNTEAVKMAKKYIKMGGPLQIQISKNGKGSDYAFYSLSIKNTKTNENASMDMTAKGGYPIWFINSRNIKTQTISLNDAADKAASYLKETGFKNMHLFESTQYDNTGVFVFIPVQNNIRIYPESVKVKVALDNGEIVGMSDEEYLQWHFDRKITPAHINKVQARSKISPNLKVEEENKALIINSLNQEVLCYEFLGVIGNETYRLFINAENGKEEKVEKLDNAEGLQKDIM